MKIKNLKIEGFRRHLDSEVCFSDATFLIGENNAGKSAVLKAIVYLLSDKKKIPENEFFTLSNHLECDTRYSDKIILTAEFDSVGEEAIYWRGFKGRLFPYTDNDGESKFKFTFRKTFEIGKDYIVEMKEFKRSVLPQFEQCKNLDDYIENGISLDRIREVFGDVDTTRKLTSKQKSLLPDLEEIYDFSGTETWFKNPGGFPGNVLKKLPKVLLIPAEDKKDDLTSSTGALMSTLNELFNDVREQSTNFHEAQRYLELLANELDPENEDSEFGIMMGELNKVLGEVFPTSGIHAITQLSDADKVIRPQFKISMSSNIKTDVDLQGTGSTRAAVFALLRYRSIRKNRGDDGTDVRPLIICFEEPELYLHPNASQQMRDTIYTLAGSANNQIVCTTHSPYMIDLSQRPNQLLNLLVLRDREINIEDTTVSRDIVTVKPFNTSEAYRNLQSNDRDYVKMLLKIDDYIAKVFFTKNVLIIEGDTEEVVFKETIVRMNNENRLNVLQNWQIVKARGKAVIIPLVKYLKAMGLEPFVMHDKDSSTPGAVKFNQPILDAVMDESRVIVIEDCIEDILGYASPSSDKPYKAFKFIKENWTNYDSINQEWKDIIEELFRN